MDSSRGLPVLVREGREGRCDEFTGWPCGWALGAVSAVLGVWSLGWSRTDLAFCLGVGSNVGDLVRCLVGTKALCQVLLAVLGARSQRQTLWSLPSLSNCSVKDLSIDQVLRLLVSGSGLVFCSREGPSPSIYGDFWSIFTWKMTSDVDVQVPSLWAIGRTVVASTWAWAAWTYTSLRAGRPQVRTMGSADLASAACATWTETSVCAVVRV